jgi:hypothetical protein
MVRSIGSTPSVEKRAKEKERLVAKNTDIMDLPLLPLATSPMPNVLLLKRDSLYLLWFLERACNLRANSSPAAPKRRTPG